MTPTDAKRQDAAPPTDAVAVLLAWMTAAVAPKPAPKFLDLEQAAQHLRDRGIAKASAAYIRARIADGDLKPLECDKAFYVSAAELDAFLDQRPRRRG